MDLVVDKEPFGKRHAADSLAIVCALRPAQYALIRVLATVVVVLGLSFVCDALSWIMSWVASNEWLSFLIFDFFTSAEDRAAITGGKGFSYDGSRLLALGVTLAVLIAVQLKATKNLPSGIAAMKASVIEGPPWPGRWRSVARQAAKLRPWLVTAAVVATVFVMARATPPLTEDDFIGLFFLLIFVAAAGTDGRTALVRTLPSFIDVSETALHEAEVVVLHHDREQAELQWPRKPPLRLHAAVRVFAAPPPPLRHRHERTRHAWWTGTETSVEALATELVVQALVEAGSMGLVSISEEAHRNPQVATTLPADAQPHGLAALVVGVHREGLVLGRTVRGTLADMLEPVGSVDQYSAVIAIALGDLEIGGIATREPTTKGWRLSAGALEQAAAALPSASASEQANDTTPSDNAVAAPLASLRSGVAKQLRRKRRTDAPTGGTIFQLLGWGHQSSKERTDRLRYQLPERPAE